MKKTLALVLALAMVFSSMTVAFAEGTLSAEAQICAELGMLKGETGTVDAAYTATTPSRIQAVVMFLRLKGLEEEALAFTGQDNFADADKAAWAKPIMAYLKANPQLGWLGDGTNFNPTEKVTAKMYYKVLLEALGYKQNTAEVVGDFTWENVLDFAASIGLSKVANVEEFTVNDLAVATVEALKATVKEGGKTLIASLIEAGKVDAAKAEQLGLYTAPSTSTEAKLDSVVASANDKVEVTFDADVDKAFAENADNYKIVVKGSTTALEVKEAKLVRGKVVELTTAAQTGGAAYTLTVGDVSKNFSGVAKSTGVPEVDSVKCIDTNTVEVKFTKAMDRASVEDVANYTLNNGATVKAAELWVDQDDSRMTVKLTTDGVAKNKIYKLTISNVKSADMVALKTVTKSFSGITDTTAPKISGNIVVKNNQRFLVVFDDAHGVDKETVENIANWSIDGLQITSIVAKDYMEYGSTVYGKKDDYKYLDVVEVNTEPMTPSQKYTVTISNLVDGSTSKNAISKVLTKTFYGVAADKSGPTVGSIKVYGDNIVEIPFKDANRLDYATATDVNNYTFNEGLQVLSAEILRPSAPDHETTGKVVVLRTSTMDTDTTYKLTIANVADEFGNVMTTVSNRNIQRSKGADIKPPAVTNVAWNSKNEIVLTFDEVLDIDSANDPTNYVLNKDLGAVKKAEISGKSGYTKVTLTTPEMKTNTNYTLTINGVKDRVGNVMSDYKTYFTSSQTSVDIEAPAIENIVAVNNKEIQITFDEEVKATSGSVLTLRKVNSDGTTVAFDTASVQGIAEADFTIDGGLTVVYKLDSKTMSTSDEYMVYDLTGVSDKHNNKYKVASDDSDKETFYGNEDVQDALEVTGVDQLNMKKLQISFSRPIIFKHEAKGTRESTSAVSGYKAIIDIDKDFTTDSLSVLTLEKSSGTIQPDKELTLALSNITDYVGTAVDSDDINYKYTPYLDDEDGPSIEYVESVNTRTVKVYYNEEIDSARVGTYSITGYYSKNATKETTKKVTSAMVSLDDDDNTVINLDVSSLGLLEGEVYTLKPTTKAYDVAGNGSDIDDVSFEFVASAVEVKDYIKGVAVIDARTIEVRATGTLANVVVKNDDGEEIGNTPSYNGKVATVTLKEALIDDDDITYTVYADINGNSTSYTFEGILGDGGIYIDPSTHVITFSDWEDGNYVVKIVYKQSVVVTLTATTGVGYEAANYLANNSTANAIIPVGAKYVVEVYREATDNAPVYAVVETK